MAWFSFRKHPSDDDVNALIETLSRCKECVATSHESAWSSMDAPEIQSILDTGLSALESGRKPNIRALTFLFLPTGPLQETAMDNGWAEEYLELSSRFDDLIAKWR